MLSTSRQKRRPAPKLGHDRALDAEESLELVRAWDEARVDSLTRACRVIDRKPPLVPSWRDALTSLESYAIALSVAERATEERKRVRTAYAHVFLAQLGATTPDAKL